MTKIAADYVVGDVCIFCQSGGFVRCKVINIGMEWELLAITVKMTEVIQQTEVGESFQVERILHIRLPPEYPTFEGSNWSVIEEKDLPAIDASGRRPSRFSSCGKDLLF